jgi:hypothetical protein
LKKNFQLVSDTGESAIFLFWSCLQVFPTASRLVAPAGAIPERESTFHDARPPTSYPQKDELALS